VTHLDRWVFFIALLLLGNERLDYMVAPVSFENTLINLKIDMEILLL